MRPGEQGTGLGTALLLARLALLKENELPYQVQIYAVTKSIGFYERFGFRRIATWPDEHGAKHPIGSLPITYDESRECRKLLTRHGITVPEDQDQVPFYEGEKPSM